MRAGGLEQGCGSEGGEKSKSGYSLKTESVGFADGLDCGV